MGHEEKVYQVVIAPGANDRIQEHFEFLARISLDAASRLLDSLLADIRSLKKSPFRNPFYNRAYLAVGKYRYMITNKRYRVIYQIDGDFVFVDDIQDCRQDDDKNILDR